MVSDASIISVVTDLLAKYAKNIPLVLDPVMIAKSKIHLLLPEAVQELNDKIIPLSTIITPNISRSRALTNKLETEEMAEEILNFGSQAVLLKSEHLEGKYSKDLLLGENGMKKYLSAKKIINPQ